MNIKTKKNSLLVVFMKNHHLTKVKTRLAKSIGEKKALEIFKILCDYTINVAIETSIPTKIYWSSYVPSEDYDKCEHSVQKGSDLGERIQNALSENLLEYENIILIGSDCPSLQSTHIKRAHSLLKERDVVFGPASDGGYYLVGVKNMIPEMFNKMEWSTDQVLQRSIDRITELGLTFDLLEVESDIDFENDLKSFIELFPESDVARKMNRVLMS